VLKLYASWSEIVAPRHTNGRYLAAQYAKKGYARMNSSPASLNYFGRRKTCERFVISNYLAVLTD
jgi:hypothetical protein